MTQDLMKRCAGKLEEMVAQRLLYKIAEADA
jgi:hypothetical protein